MLRRVKIAASVFFAVLTVALCVTWVRSYWHFDLILVRLNAPNHLRIVSRRGQVASEVHRADRYGKAAITSSS
jgi:hypothetical protein